MQPKGVRYGGRGKGTQNKVTSSVKDIINQMLQNYAANNGDKASLMTADFLSLEPKDRMIIAEKLMQYTIPKMQSVAVDSSNEHRVTIEEKIAELAKVPGIDE